MCFRCDAFLKGWSYRVKPLYGHGMWVARKAPFIKVCLGPPLGGHASIPDIEDMIRTGKKEYSYHFLSDP